MNFTKNPEDIPPEEVATIYCDLRTDCMCAPKMRATCEFFSQERDDIFFDKVRLAFRNSEYPRIANSESDLNRSYEKLWQTQNDSINPKNLIIFSYTSLLFILVLALLFCIFV